jgi:hypothetical protein
MDDRTTAMWREPEGKLLLPGLLDVVRSALDAHLGRDNEAVSFQRTVVDNLPAIDALDGVAADAWRVLGGDSAATVRFRQTLELLAGEPLTSYAGSAFPLLDHDVVGVLRMAALHAGGGDRERAAAYLRTIERQLRGFALAGALYRAAIAASDGGEAEVGQFRTIALLASRMRPPDGDGPVDGDGDDPGCGRQIVRLWSGPLADDSYYQIDAIAPDHPCPGTMLTITGMGFGTAGGRVQFSRQGGGSVFVPASDWSDTVVHVALPENAACGPMGLRIIVDTIEVCDRHIPLYKVNKGHTVLDGGVPAIAAFTCNGARGTVVVPPQGTAAIVWDACPSDSEIILDIRGGGVTQTLQGLPTAGSHALVVGAYAATTDLLCTLTASTACGSTSAQLRIRVHRTAQVYLAGIEVTQATQFFRAAEHIPNPRTWQADNMVPLIADKDTLVRVYVATDQDPRFNGGTVAGVHVELRASRHGGGQLPEVLVAPPLMASYDNSVIAQRGDLNRSANFQLPATWTSAGPALRITASASLDPGAPDVVDPARRLEWLDPAIFYPAAKLKCMLLRIRYVGPGGPVDPPGPVDALVALHQVADVYPTADVDIYYPLDMHRIVDFDGDLTDRGGGGCGRGWNDLLDMLRGFANRYGADRDLVWCAVLGPGISALGETQGCGTQEFFGGGYAAFRANDPDTAAQEIGHAFGRDHTFDDSNWPNYGNQPRSERDIGFNSIGEFGVHTRNLTLFRPAQTPDLMSYAPRPDWTSPYTYEGLMASLTWGPVLTGPRSGYSPSVGAVIGVGQVQVEHLFVSGRLWRNSGRVRLRRLYHLPARRWPALDAVGQYSIALVDAHGQALATQPIMEPAHPAESLYFAQAIALVPGVVALEVRDHSRVLARVQRQPERPVVSDLSLDTHAELWTLRWSAYHPAGVPLLYMVTVSVDNGNRYAPLIQGLRHTSYSFDPANLSGGKGCRLHVIASDGFNTATAATAQLQLPAPLPTITMLPPELRSDGSTRLQVVAVTPWYGTVPDDAITWTSDQHGELGSGRRIEVTLAQGDHRLRVTARGPGAAIAARDFTVRMDDTGPKHIQ